MSFFIKLIGLSFKTNIKLLFELIILFKKTCNACHIECKSGCRGSSQFECTECRLFKLDLRDAEKVIEVQAKNTRLKDESFLPMPAINKIDYLDRLEISINKLNFDSFKLKSNQEIIAGLRGFYLKYIEQDLKSVLDLNSVQLCVSSCPPDFHHNENTCNEYRY